MTEKHDTYRSIGCSYYDQLEALSVKRTRCAIVYRDGDAERTTEGIIKDLYAKDAAEFLTLDNGTVIRLDHIVSVNGIPLTYAC
jgi:Rho-binding antiterminator